MVFTLNSPTSGRIGPGAFFSLTDDFIGPYASNHYATFAIEETATGRVMIRQQMPISHFTFWTAGYHGPPSFFIQGSNTGLADGAAVQLRSEQVFGFGTPFDVQVTTGFTWDALSILWELTYLNNAFLLGSLGGSATKIDQILAAVKKTYSTP